MKRIAVLTSGGDAPGMNAALRAVVRVGVSSGLEVAGVRQGYTGLIEGKLQPLGPRDVASIIHVGGTMLGSARCAEFRTPEGRKRALQVLEQNAVEGLVVIGGNGSLSGAHALSQAGFPVVGVASTIDNDLNGADITIGVDTALNTALEAIDRLKTTATSHQRAFVVEVMGRSHGYLALMVGLAGGADVVVTPKWKATPTPWPRLCGTPTPAANGTPWWSWPKGRSGTRRRWPITSRTTATGSASSCAPRSSGTCSAAAGRARSTGCWRAAPPRRRSTCLSPASPASTRRSRRRRSPRCR